MQSGWNVRVWLVDVVSRSGVCLVGVVVRRYIDFLILLIPTPLVSVLFCSSIPTFCSFLTLGAYACSEGYCSCHLTHWNHKKEIPTDSSQYGNDFKRGDFCKNVSFKSYGIVC